MKREDGPPAARAAIGGVVLLALAVRLVYGPWPIDDAYITFRYARNLAAGMGFVYNPGAPVLGTTTPGYTLLLVPPARLGLDLHWVSWGVATVCDLLTAWLLARLGFRAGRPWTGVLAALLLLLAPKLLTWSSVSGMETPLYVLAIVATVWLYCTGRLTSAAVVLGLTLWVRPDALLIGLAVGLYARLTRCDPPLRQAAVAALVALPWVLFSWWYFGSPVPASVTAKASSNDLSAAQSLLVLGGHFVATWYERLLLLPFLVGLAVTARRPGPGQLLLLWGALYGLAFGLAGAFGHHLWYFVPLYLPYFWCAGAGLEALARFLARRLPVAVAHPPAAARAGWAALGALTALLLWQTHLNLGHTASEQAVREQLYREVATSLTAVSHGEPLAATEVGVLGWYYDGPVLDLVGLVTPEAVGRPYVETMHAAQGPNDAGPRWLVTYDDRFDDPAVLDEAWFRREWAVTAAYPITATRTLYVFARSTI
jgi:arabinofuranosyltransferase